MQVLDIRELHKYAFIGFEGKWLAERSEPRLCAHRIRKASARSPGRDTSASAEGLRPRRKDQPLRLATSALRPNGGLRRLSGYAWYRYELGLPVSFLLYSTSLLLPTVFWRQDLSSPALVQYKLLKGVSRQQVVSVVLKDSPLGPDLGRYFRLTQEHSDQGY